MAFADSNSKLEMHCLMQRKLNKVKYCFHCFLFCGFKFKIYFKTTEKTTKHNKIYLTQYLHSRGINNYLSVSTPTQGLVNQFQFHCCIVFLLNTVLILTRNRVILTSFHKERSVPRVEKDDQMFFDADSLCTIKDLMF